MSMLISPGNSAKGDWLNTGFTHSETRHNKSLWFNGRSIYSPSEILEISDKIQQRTSLHDIVHVFKLAHGFALEIPTKDLGRYNRLIEDYQTINNSSPNAEAIKTLSDPSYYHGLRNGVRLRCYHGIVNEQSVLHALSKEIRAGLNWWDCNFEGHKQLDPEKKSKTSISLCK